MPYDTLMKKIGKTRFPTKLFFVSVAVIAGVYLIFSFIAPYLIDSAKIQSTVVQAVEAATGRKLVLQGKPRVSLMGKPTVHLGAAELSDVENQNIKIADLAVQLNYGAFIGRQAVATGVVLYAPVVEITAKKDAGENPFAALTALLNHSGGALDITVKDGLMVLSRSNDTAPVRVENIELSWHAGGALQGQASWQGHLMTVSGSLPREQAENASAKPVVLQLASGADRISFNGERQKNGEGFQWKGALELTVQDMLGWFLPPVAEGTLPRDKLPLSLTANVVQANTTTQLADVKLEALKTSLAGSGSVQWEATPRITMALKGPTLDGSALKYWLEPKLAASRATLQAAYSRTPLPEVYDAPFDISLKIEAEKATAEPYHVENFSLEALLADKSITIQRMDFLTAGQTEMAFGGLIDTGAKGIKFFGNMRVKGKSLRDFLLASEPSAAQLPPERFADFSTQANLYIAADQVRLSEANVKLGELNLSGGLAGYFDANPRVEADMRLNNINLDYFRDIWRENQKPDEKRVFFIALDQGQDFSWLRNLATSVDLKVAINGFTLLDRRGDNLTFRLFAKPGQIELLNFNAFYGADTLEGRAQLNVQGEVPKLDLVLNTAQIDARYFAVDPDETLGDIVNKTPGENKWREELFDVSWMNGFNGSFDVSLGALIWRGEKLRNFKLKSFLQDNKFTVQKGSFDWKEAKLDYTGSFFGGKVPAVSLSFMLYNADLPDIMNLLTTRKNITGKASVSGAVSGAGINWLSFINNMDLKLVLAARGVWVDGINIPAVLSAVKTARETTELSENINRLLPDGRTPFSLDGQINVQGAVARTPGITLKTGDIIGNLSGDLRLIPWDISMNTLFQFPALTSETVPTLTVQVNGPVEATQMRIDTSSLEAYVAKRIVGQ